MYQIITKALTDDSHYVPTAHLADSGVMALEAVIDPLPAAVVEAKVAGAARRYMSARNKFSAA